MTSLAAVKWRYEWSIRSRRRGTESLYLITKMYCEPSSSVSIATDYGLDGPGIDSDNVKNECEKHTRKMDNVPKYQDLAPNTA
jgi:hypothetical protein